MLRALTTSSRTLPFATLAPQPVVESASRARPQRQCHSNLRDDAALVQGGCARAWRRGGARAALLRRTDRAECTYMMYM